MRIPPNHEASRMADGRVRRAVGDYPARVWVKACKQPAMDLANATIREGGSSDAQTPRRDRFPRLGATLASASTSPTSPAAQTGAPRKPQIDAGSRGVAARGSGG